MSIKPLERNLFVYQSSDYANTISLGFKDTSNNLLDFTGLAVTSNFRQWFISNTFWSFTATGSSNATISLALAGVASANIPYGKYVYDVLVGPDASNTIYKVMEGTVTIVPSATTP